MLVEFPYTFESDPVRGRELKEELTTDEALSGLLNRAIDGLGRVATMGFSEVYSPDELVDRYQRISDPIAEFAEECLENVPENSGWTHYLPKTDVYACYTQWAEAAGKRTKNKRTFYTALERSPAVTTLDYRPQRDDGTRPRSYKNIKFTETGKEFVKYD
jgi:putative DNA primase/helicase